MSYYPKQIKYYRNVTSFTTSIEEVMHIIQIKDFFKWINMRKSYKKQILNHKLKKFSLIVRNDIDIFSFTKVLIEIDKNAVL